MHISAIISEYNPFHNGHTYHIKQTRVRGATHIIAIMSGNFVQRGDFAMFSKWSRAKMALASGVDLVIELPILWAISSAERFSLGGVTIADALGCVDSLSFGSESGNIELLCRAKNAVISDEIKPALKKQLNCGITFGAARQLAVEAVYGTEIADVLHSPNNILAIEYLKALDRLHSKITPITIKRRGAGHDSDDSSGTYLSASKLRKFIFEGRQDLESMISSPVVNIIKEEIIANAAPSNIFTLERAVLAKLRSMSKQDFVTLPDVTEGLENRIIKAVRKSTSLEELYRIIKTKRYPMARIRRIILSAFLEINQSDHTIPIPYLRVLGFNNRGKEILKKAKKNASLPIITKFSDILLKDANAKKVFSIECKASDFYQLSLPQIGPCGTEMTSQTVRIIENDFK